MATCAECGDEVGTSYDCRDCGDAFCVDCRLPGDHECMPTQDASAPDGGTTTATPSRISLPSAPRITTLLPLWRAVPWQIHVLLAIALAPLPPLIGIQLSPFVLGYHVYHERVASSLTRAEASEDVENESKDAEGKPEDADGSEEAAGSWTPSWGYYFPILIFLSAIPIGQPSFYFTIGGIAGIIASLIYAVQKLRHGASLLSR